MKIAKGSMGTITTIEGTRQSSSSVSLWSLRKYQVQSCASTNDIESKIDQIIVLLNEIKGLLEHE